MVFCSAFRISIGVCECSRSDSWLHLVLTPQRLCPRCYSLLDFWGLVHQWRLLFPDSLDSSLLKHSLQLNIISQTLKQKSCSIQIHTSCDCLKKKKKKALRLLFKEGLDCTFPQSWFLKGLVHLTFHFGTLANTLQPEPWPFHFPLLKFLMTAMLPSLGFPGLIWYLRRGLDTTDHSLEIFSSFCLFLFLFFTPVMLSFYLVLLF